MKLALIERRHIQSAAEIMDKIGDSTWAEYWVQLENGREYQFKHLIKKAYELASGERVSNDFFQSNEGYRSYISRKFKLPIIFKVPNNTAFFTQESFSHFANYAGKKYRNSNKEDETVGYRIKREIFDKTNLWGKLLNLDDWHFVYDNRWQLSGRFKPYSFVRICKHEDKDKKVFFTLGVDGTKKALVYKLDCQRKQYTPENALTKSQVIEFDRIISGTHAEWNEISINEISKLDWETLRQLTIDFIGKYEFLYYEAINAIYNVSTRISGNKVISSLLEFAPPKKAFDKLPAKAYSFKGTVIDYDSQNKRAKEIGDGGEELIIEREKKILSDNGLFDLADKVVKMKDGEGFDILSFDLDKQEKHIEVKTTIGINTRPFIMTDNEWGYMKLHPFQYHLYRIYDYNPEKKSGKIFILSGDLEEKVYIRQKQVEVFLKSSE